MTQKKLTLLSAAVTSFAASVYLTANDAAAQVAGVQNGANSAKGVDQPVDLIGDGGTFSVITNVLLFIVGAIAVIMIVIGGLRYVLSGGNSEQITAAKNTILYAIVGIIVALLAYAAVNFVLSSFAPGTTGGTNL